MTAPELAERLAAVQARIDGAGGDVTRITIVAVVKDQPAGVVEVARAVGCTDFGDNYVRELNDHARALAAHSAWFHYLGEIQRDTVRRIEADVRLWHGVDRTSAARRISARRPGAAVLVQVNVSGEPQKLGCGFAEAPALVEECAALGLDVRGLMAVGPLGDPEASRPGFRELRVLADGLGLVECSMGMSDDLEVAVQEGATIVRVGRALFGPRPPPPDLRR